MRPNEIIEDGQVWAPYCGAAPSPADLALRWNLDPWLILALVVLAGAYVHQRRRVGAAGDPWAAAAGLVLVVAFVSPLCALSSALFSARVLHHALLVVVAAPLLAKSLPIPRRGPPLAAAVALHAATFWFWHAPGPYGWALGHDAAYWLMQITLLVPAVVFWRSVRAVGGLPAAGAMLAVMVASGMLGALITFAPAPLYAPHLTTTAAWGLAPLADQQLAGLIMWAPMAAAYLLGALALVGRSLAPGREAVA